MAEDCPLCRQDKNTKTQIETDYTLGYISAVDVVNQIGVDKIDLLAVMIHMQDHAGNLDEEADEKREFMGEPIKEGTIELAGPVKTEAEAETELADEYVTEPLPEIAIDLDSDHLTQLYGMLGILKEKLFAIKQGKDMRSLGVLTKETRETLKEIERVKISTRASMADRTDALMDEHNELNKFLMFNLCGSCADKHKQYLAGTFKTFAVDAHGKDRTDNTTDVDISRTVE